MQRRNKKCSLTEMLRTCTTYTCTKYLEWQRIRILLQCSVTREGERESEIEHLLFCCHLSILPVVAFCTLCSHLEHMFRTFFIIKKLLAADSGNDGHDNDAAATPIAQTANQPTNPPIRLYPRARRKKAAN